MATLGLTAINKVVTGELDIDYPVTPADLGVGSFSPLETIDVFYDRFEGIIYASLNEGEVVVDIFTGVFTDLKPARWPEEEATILFENLTDENYYNFSAPVAEHRYHFLSSDSSDSGSGTAANGVDTGTIVYDGKAAQSTGGAVDTNYFTATSSLTAASISILFTKTATGGTTRKLFESNAINGFGDINVFGLDEYLTFNPNGSTDVAYGPLLDDKKYLVTFNYDGVNVDLYLNGLLVDSNQTPTSNSMTEFYGLKSGYLTDLMTVSSTALTPTQVTKLYEDSVKSGLISQQYVSHNGKSRVVTVKTTGGDFTNTQTAVDSLLEGNETVVVFDGISPTATGLPVNAQIIDLAVSSEPEYSTWERWPWGAEESLTISGGGSITDSISKSIDLTSAITGGGDITTSTIVPVEDTTYVKAPITGGGTLTSSILKDSYKTSEVSGGGSLSTTLSSLVEVQATLSGGGNFTEDILKVSTMTSTMSGGGNLTITLSYDRYVKAPVTGGGEVTTSFHKEVSPDSSISGGGDLLLDITKTLETSLVIEGGGDLSTNAIKSVERLLSVSGGGFVNTNSIDITKNIEGNISGGGFLNTLIRPDKTILGNISGGGELTSHLSEELAENLYFNAYYSVNVDYLFKVKGDN